MTRSRTWIILMNADPDLSNVLCEKYYYYAEIGSDAVIEQLAVKFQIIPMSLGYLFITFHHPCTINKCVERINIRSSNVIHYWLSNSDPSEIQNYLSTCSPRNIKERGDKFMTPQESGKKGYFQKSLRNMNIFDTFYE